MGKDWPGYAKGTIPDEGFEWRFIDATPADIPNRNPACAYIPFGYSKEVLPKGWQKTKENKPLDLDIIFEKDVEVTLRDGIYIDIYRPKDSNEKVPIIIPYSPYGKGGGGANLMDVVPYRVGVPKSRQSGLEKFEGPDPNEWCMRGYAIVDPNTRGSFDSEGDLYYYGQKDCEDAYDLIEAVAKYEWCNGSVGMAGNSWLGIAQYWAAMAQPPSLKAIAPWEGWADMYRDRLRRGGIPWTAFTKWVFLGVPGRGRQEDVPRLAQEHEFYDAYWASKRVDFSKVKVPSYILGSYSTSLHLTGSIRAFRESNTENKWLRIHPHQEWYEDYYHSSVDDLDRFFTRYLKGVENGWEATPKVRVSLYRFGQTYPVYDQVETDYPIPRTKYVKMYLTDKNTLQGSPSKVEAVHSYDATAKGAQLHYDYYFDKRSRLAGFSKIHLFVSCKDHNDLDIYVILRKLSSDGVEMEQSNVPLHELPSDIRSVSDVKNVSPCKYLGPTGMLRASHRGFDEEKSTEYWPFHTHTKAEYVTPGDVVELHVGIWPMGIVFEKGEGIRVNISGRDMRLPEWDNPLVKDMEPICNKGRHHVHLGGKYSDSYVLLPFI